MTRHAEERTAEPHGGEDCLLHGAQTRACCQVCTHKQAFEKRRPERGAQDNEGGGRFDATATTTTARAEKRHEKKYLKEKRKEAALAAYARKSHEARKSWGQGQSPHHPRRTIFFYF